MKKPLCAVALSIAIALTACHHTRKTAGAEKPEDCAGVMCTRMFASVSIHVTDAASNPITLEEAYTVRKSTGETIRYERNAAGRGYYTVVDDSYRKNLSGKTDEFQFVGMRNGTKVIDETLRISADCCHVKREDGKLEVILGN